MSFTFPERERARPIWLVTFADLALLLVGFFVLLQSDQRLDRAALARGLRDGFGAPAASASAMPVAASGMSGFAPGSAALPGSPQAVIAWARDAARDPRVTLTVTGFVDGTPDDVDSATGSGAMLAIDRARTLAAALAQAVPARRLVITNAVAPRRGVIVTLGFSGPTR